MGADAPSWGSRGSFFIQDVLHITVTCAAGAFHITVMRIWESTCVLVVCKLSWFVYCSVALLMLLSLLLMLYSISAAADAALLLCC